MYPINLSDEYVGAAYMVFKQAEEIERSQMTNEQMADEVKASSHALLAAIDQPLPDDEVQRLAVKHCAQVLYYISNYNENING